MIERWCPELQAFVNHHRACAGGPHKLLSVQAEQLADAIQSKIEAAGAKEHSDPLVRRIERFAFDISDQVFIKDIERPGVVSSLCIDGRGPQYQVEYWYEGSRKSTWLMADELKAKP